MVSTSIYVELVSARSSGTNVGHIVRSVSMHMVSNRRKKVKDQLSEVNIKLSRVEAKVDILATEMKRLVDRLTEMTNVLTLAKMDKPEKEN